MTKFPHRHKFHRHNKLWRWRNFNPFWGGNQNLDPQTKTFQQIWYQGLKTSILCKFEAFILKNKNFKILTFLGREPKLGPQNQNFSTDMISGLKYQYPVWIGSFYLEKQKFLNFELFGAGTKTGTPKPKFFNRYDIRA